MDKFIVERKISSMAEKKLSQKTKELLMQINAMQSFYKNLGIDSKNIQTIFKLTIGYLEGKTDKLEVNSFFEALMLSNKVMNDKELNLLNCFDDLLSKHEEDIEAASNDTHGNDDMRDVA